MTFYVEYNFKVDRIELINFYRVIVVDRPVNIEVFKFKTYL